MQGRSWLINASRLSTTKPYSPGLSHSDCFAFSKFKLKTKGDRFENIKDIRKAVRDKLKTIPVVAFRVMEDLETRSLRYIEVEGGTTFNNVNVEQFFYVALF